MNQDPVTVRQIQWSRVIPGLLLLRAASVACSVQVLVPALACVLLCNAGKDSIANWFDDPDTSSAGICRESDDQEASQSNSGSDEWFGEYAVSGDVGRLPEPLITAVSSATDLLANSVKFSIQPAMVLAWHAAVLGFFGVAVGRCTAESVCRHSRVGVLGSLKFGAKKSGKTVISTVIAGGLVFALLLLGYVVRGIYSVPAVGQLAVACGWPLVILLAVLTIGAAVVCGIGWSLSLGAIGTDQCDGSDALSRGISYELSRPLATVQYGFGILALMLIFGNGAELLLKGAHSVMSGVLAGAEPPSETASQIISLWRELAAAMPEACQLAIFFSGNTIAYLLLRQKEDGIQPDEIDGGRPLS